MGHPTEADLRANLEHLRAAPATTGRLDLVVRRPTHGEREILTAGQLDIADGLVGDNWLTRATASAIANGRHLKAQLTVMSSRMVRLLASTETHQALAGDQLFVDLDISVANLPSGSRLAIGPDAVIEVTDKPHNGCAKFTSRFGQDAMMFVNSTVGKQLRLRGFNARVVNNGLVHPGDSATVLGR
jgi:hypothetical protein